MIKSLFMVIQKTSKKNLKVETPLITVKSTDNSGKHLSAYGTAGLTLGLGAGLLETTIGYNSMVKSVASELSNKGFLNVKITSEGINFFGISNSVPAEYKDGHWVLENKVNLDGLLLGANAPALVAGASVLAVPFYMKKHPGVALAHLLVAGGEVIGNYVKNNKLDGLQLYGSGAETSFSYTLRDFAVNHVWHSDTNPALFYLDELALGLYGAGIALAAFKGLKDYKQSRVPSEAVEDYAGFKGVNEEF